MADMKKVSLILMLVLFLGCKNGKVQNISNTVIGQCLVDVNKSQKTLDISDLFVDDLEIVQLETNDNCLISEILKVQYMDDYIYVSDQVAQCVFQFSQSGNFVKRIGSRGEGPIDYSSIGDFVVNDQYLYIKDLYGNKILRYGLNDNSVETLPLGDIGVDEMIDFGSSIYCISNYRNYEKGCFNLYKLDLATRQMISLLPSDKKIAEAHSAWGLNRYASKNKDTALLIYPLNDTIYTVTKDSVYPQMIVSFSERSLPENMRYQNVMETVNAASKWILGMDCIKESKSYIFFEYGDNGIQKSAMIDKKTFSCETTDRFVLGNWGDLYVSTFEIHNDIFYTMQPAYFFRRSWQEIYSKRSFKNKKDRDKLQKISETIQEEDNPIILKLKFK